jgi:hypothetical protein
MAQYFSWEIYLANQALLPNVVKMFVPCCMILNLQIIQVQIKL